MTTEIQLSCSKVKGKKWNLSLSYLTPNQEIQILEGNKHLAFWICTLFLTSISACTLTYKIDICDLPYQDMSMGDPRQPTPLFLPGESHGQRNLVGYNP